MQPFEPNDARRHRPARPSTDLHQGSVRHHWGGDATGRRRGSRAGRPAPVLRRNQLQV